MIDIIIRSNNPINVSLDLPDGNYIVNMQTSRWQLTEHLCINNNNK